MLVLTHDSLVGVVVVVVAVDLGVNSQVSPTSFTKPGDHPPGQPPLFEALYPRVYSPSDTRHFVEEPEEELVVSADENFHADKFSDF